MKKIESVLALFALAPSLLCAAAVELTVLQSTDIHGSPNIVKFAKWIAAERASDPEALVVDCGDLCNGTFETYCDGGASMVSFLNHCRYDVWIPGNHEFRIGNANFRKDLSLFTSGSVLAANIVFDDPAKKPSVPVLPWKMFTRRGIKIAVIGMASHRCDDWYDVNPYKGLRLLSPTDALKAVMPEVRAAKPDVIIVAAHSDLAQPAETVTGNDEWIPSKDVYTRYPDIALILAGHTHRLLAATEFASGQWIVQPQDNGVSMAKIKLVFDPAAHKVVSVASEFAEAKKLPAGDESAMPEVWRKNNAAAALAAKTPVVRIPDEYVWRPKAKKGGLPPTILAEAVRAEVKADAAILNAKRILRPTSPELTAKFFYGLPCSGISVLTLTPEQLKTALAAEGDISQRSAGIDPGNLPAKPITVAFDAYDIAGCDGERMPIRELARSGVPRREAEINVREAVRRHMMSRWGYGDVGCLAAAGRTAPVRGSEHEKVFCVVAHPDDMIACAGTMLLLKDRFEIHEFCLTHGERGLGEKGFRDGTTKVIRTKEEESAAAMLNAKLYWGDEIDGEAFAGREPCEKLAALLKAVRPRAVFAMSPLERHPDHAMSSAVAQKAIHLAGMRDKLEVYFMEEAYDSRSFQPVYTVDITEVLDLKRAYIRKSVSQNANDQMCHDEILDSLMRGQRSVTWVHHDYGTVPEINGEIRLSAAERFAVRGGLPQGSRCIFNEMPLPSCGWNQNWNERARDW